MEEIQEYWHLERWRGSFGRYQSLNEYLSALFASHSSELVNPDLLYIVNSMKTFSGYYERDYHHVRGKYNPYECLGKGPKDNPYLNRSALKLANLDSIFSILHPSDGIFLWADICGGPGGFSEYILTRFGDDMKLIGYGMSMVHPQGSSCNWNLDYLHDPPRIAIIEDLQSKIDSDKLFFIHHGEDTTGNILHRPNIEAFEHFILSKSDDGVDFFCGDGGMEDGRDKEDQEMIHLPLILSQIIAMIGVLRTHGSFLLKTFSLFKV